MSKGPNASSLYRWHGMCIQLIVSSSGALEKNFETRRASYLPWEVVETEKLHRTFVIFALSGATLFSPEGRLGYRNRGLSPFHQKLRFFHKWHFTSFLLGLGSQFRTVTRTSTRKTHKHKNTHTHKTHAKHTHPLRPHLSTWHGHTSRHLYLCWDNRGCIYLIDKRSRKAKNARTHAHTRHSAHFLTTFPCTKFYKTFHKDETIL